MRRRGTMTGIGVGILALCLMGAPADEAAGYFGGGGCFADVDGDGEVAFTDLTALLSAWGPCPGRCPEDLDGDGGVGFPDLATLLGAWGGC